MSWKEDARRTIVSEKKDLVSFPGYWVKPKKYSVKGRDEINEAERKVQKNIDKKALMKFARRLKDKDEYKDLSEEQILEKIPDDELIVMMDLRMTEVFAVNEAKIKHGIACHNFCDGDIDTRSTEKDIQGFARDILEFEDIAVEIIGYIEEFNRPLAVQSSLTSETLQSGSTEDQNLSTETNSQTAEIPPNS